MSGAGTWLTWWGPLDDRAPILLCLSQAGAGCGQFRAWQSVLGEAVAVIGVQLPGRERRWAEPPAGHIGEIVAGVAGELTAICPAGRPLVVYGHCFGGLLGYEVARHPSVHASALVVAASVPPHEWSAAGARLAMDIDELERLLAGRGLGADELDEDSRQLVLAAMAADAALSGAYTGDGAGPVPCPLEA